MLYLLSFDSVLVVVGGCWVGLLCVCFGGLVGLLGVGAVGLVVLLIDICAMSCCMCSISSCWHALLSASRDVCLIMMSYTFGVIVRAVLIPSCMSFILFHAMVTILLLRQGVV